MDAKTALQSKKESKQPQTIKQWIVAMQPEIAKALPSVITPERFTRMAMTAVSTNPKLGECTPQSFIGALMQCSQLGLEPNTPLGQAYLIPYRNKGVLEASFQLGYKGLIDLAHRSGEFREIYAEIVYSNDTFDYSLGLNRKLEHEPAEGDRGVPVKVYAVYKLINGGYGFVVMTFEEVKAHATRYSKSYGSGPWTSDFEEMAKKTVLKKALKYAPLKTEFVREIVQDGTIKNEISKDMTEVESENVFEAEYQVHEEPAEGQQ